MRILERELKLIKEKVVDFESFTMNVYDMKKFEKLGWMSFFDVVNGSCYTTLVKGFKGY